MEFDCNASEIFVTVVQDCCCGCPLAGLPGCLQLSVAGHVSWHRGRMVRVCPHRHAKRGGHEQTGFWEWSQACCELRAMLSNQWEVS